MFTGIIEELGTVASFDGRLVIEAATVTSDAAIDDSIAVNGVCLTVVERTDSRLAFDVSDETRNRTSLTRLQPGARVNLERPLTLQSRIGGHLVQGHIDGVGIVVGITPVGVGSEFEINIPVGLRRYLADKGSITVDGVSLTVARRTEQGCVIALIPHTLAVTTLGTAHAGDPVNIEVDVIARYVEALEEAR